MIDTRGTTLEVGQPVAYNISGQVAKGRIVALRQRTFSYSAWQVKVELLHRAAGKEPGHVSEVRKPCSVLVLLDGEH